jgi:glycerophosphoryl diester phosphodiesterase
METLLHDLSWVPPLRTPELTILFNALTWLGYTPFFLLFLPLGYWLWDKDMFTRLAVLIVLNAVINSFLKDLFNDPRPDLSFAIDPRTAGSYGLPSGHSQVATAMWLWLAYEMKRWWAWPIAIAIVAGVAFSRLYLGVHDVEDVAAGVLLGLSSLVIFRAFISEQFQGWHDMNPGLQIAIILALHPILFLLWPSATGPGPVLSLGAFLVGWWAGVVYDRNRMDFKRHPNWLIALLAAGIGIAGVILAFGRIEGSFIDLGMPKLAASWLQSLIIALYVTMLAPLLFRTTRLAK